MYNNPLLYIDPSGNVSQGGGGDCKGCGIGIGPGDQTGTSWDIEQFGKDYGIDRWLNKNFNLKNWDRWRKDKISLNNIFGRHKNSGPPPNLSSYVSLNQSPITSQKIKIHSNGDEWLRSGGYDPDRNISEMDESARDSYVKRMRQNVYPADILYNDAGKPGIKYDSAISDYGKYENKIVTIYAKAFTTNRDLFLTIMHEGMHAWDYHHGLIAAWGYNYRAITETRAYQMMYYFDNNVFNNGNHSHYYDLYFRISSKSGFNNFTIQNYPIFFNNIQR